MNPFLSPCARYGGKKKEEKKHEEQRCLYHQKMNTLTNEILPGDSRDIQHQVEIPSHKTVSCACQQL
jgi:hypothetical protein